ncbi:MAG: thioesterase II family protein [Chloroflexota bacterium]|nr:thioesterase II family protein [Chloroflexota bacterium]
MASVYTTKTNSWLACSRPNPRANLRLFCFPYSGAGASIFYAWSDALPAMIEVYPVQLPGRETRLAEPPFTRLAPLVQAVAQALLPYLVGDKPFAFFGHSLGALVSFELARHLRQRHGPSPVHLFVSGHNAPQIPDREPPIHALPETEFVEKLRRLNGMNKETLENVELMELLLPILRADFAVCETYVYEADEPLDCPISAFGGLQDEYVSRENLAAWHEQTSASFSLRMFPGDHFYLNTERLFLLRALAQELTNGGIQYL